MIIKTILSIAYIISVVSIFLLQSDGSGNKASIICLFAVFAGAVLISQSILEDGKGR